MRRLLICITGDEASVTDFVPLSPPRRINRDSGQLEVRPDTAERRPPRRRKDKSKSASDGQTTVESPEHEPVQGRCFALEPTVFPPRAQISLSLRVV